MGQYSKRDFEKFYRENIDKIYRFVYFRVGQDKELTEDLVSEIFIKALDHFQDFDEKKGKSAWLYTIAKNHLANYWRDHKGADPFPEINDEGEEEGVWLKQAVLRYQQSGAQFEIYEFLAKISAEERDIVTYHYIFGYNYNEIAVMQGKTESAVKVAAHRAIKKMREYL